MAARVAEREAPDGADGVASQSLEREQRLLVAGQSSIVLFRVFVARGNPKAHAMVQHLWRVSETGPASSPTSSISTRR